MNDCEGCRYENSTDIRMHLEFCTYCQRAYAGIDRYYHVDRYEKPKTNADKIRSMSDEELAEFLGEFATRTCHYCLECGISCKDERLKWLKAEAEGE